MQRGIFGEDGWICQNLFRNKKIQTITVKSIKIPGLSGVSYKDDLLQVGYIYEKLLPKRTFFSKLKMALVFSPQSLSLFTNIITRKKKYEIAWN